MSTAFLYRARLELRHRAAAVAACVAVLSGGAASEMICRPCLHVFILNFFAAVVGSQPCRVCDMKHWKTHASVEHLLPARKADMLAA